MSKNNKVYYKVLHKNMKSPSEKFQYELNKKYEVGDVRLYGYGFHACKNIYELIIYCGKYKLKNCRFFKCTIGDIIKEDNHMVASNGIILIQELNKKFVIKEIEDHLNELINDPEWFVRKAVAKQGYSLDVLANDPNYFVRQTVAEQGYRLDKLINDPYWFVRYAVAKQGYGLDILINDPDGYVRKAVAQQGYGLDKLINDPDPNVRKAVAEQGYGLDILINDPDGNVEQIARRMYKKQMEKEKTNEKIN